MAGKFRRLLKWLTIAISLVLGIALAALVVAWFRSDNDCGERAAAPQNPMSAVVYCEYGSPDVLKILQIERPVPQGDQLLVRVHTASVNPLDWHYMRGTPYAMRLSSGLRVPEATRLGVDFAGTVEAIGDQVKMYKPGDAVFGGRTGAFAEYVLVREESVVAKPESISFEHAATVPIAALTALQAVRNHAKLRPGQTVLINGASGGVGTFAVQIAKAHGASVTGVCSTRNVELVRSLGADAVVDYTRDDFTTRDTKYDAIIDMVGNHPLSAYRRVLKPDGIYVLVGGPKGRFFAPMDGVLRMAVADPFVSQQLGFMMARLNRADLAVMAELLESGRVTPVIDRRYPLTAIADAIRYLETGRARGKVVINVLEGAGSSSATEIVRAIRPSR